MCYNGCTDERKDGIHMAHMEKYKQANLVPVLRESYRQLREYRNYVDETRTEQNYTLGCQTWKEVISKAKERAIEIMDGKKLNKQANPLFSWVVTYPKGRTSVSERDFFEGVRDYMSDLYGEANVMAVCVHMDETTPHCHCYIVPESISRKNGKRTVSTASLLDKKHLQKFHKEFDEFMYERFGERNLIELPEEDKSEDNVPMLEFKKRKLKAEVTELITREQELTDSVTELDKDVLTLENEMRILEEKRKEDLERSKTQTDAKISDYQQKKVEELKQYLERSQTLIKAEISDYRDKRVKEIDKELEPLEARKKRMEKHIEELEVRNKELEDYQTHLDNELVQVRKNLNKMRQAFLNLWDYLKDWQRLKVKEEFKNAHVQQEKNDDWDMEM